MGQGIQMSGYLFHYVIPIELRCAKGHQQKVRPNRFGQFAILVRATEQKTRRTRLEGGATTEKQAEHWRSVMSSSVAYH